MPLLVMNKLTDYFICAVVHVLDLGSNRNASESSANVQHSLPILQIALDQSGPTVNRTLAILDKTRDLYIVAVRSPHRSFSKLGKYAKQY